MRCKPLICLLLALSLLLPSGCGQAEAEPQDTVWVTEILDLLHTEKDSFEITAHAVTGTEVYFACLETLRSADGIQEFSRLRRFDPATGQALPLPSFRPDVLPGGAPETVVGLCPLEDGLWALCDRNAALQMDEAQEYVLRRLDREGTELERYTLGSFLPELPEAYSAAGVAPDGTCYFAGGGRVYAVSAENQPLLQQELPDRNCRLFTLRDGTLCAAFRQGRSTFCSLLDLQERQWREAVSLGELRGEPCPSAGDYDLMYCRDGSLIGRDMTREEGQALLPYASADIDPDTMLGAAVQPDGSVFVLTEEQWEREHFCSLLRTREMPADEAPKMQHLTCAGLSFGRELRARVRRFHRQQQAVRIHLQEYDGPRAEERLTVQLASADAPDLLCPDGLPVRSLLENGAIEDLWTYIDGDPQLSREDLMTEALDAVSVEGRLPVIFSAFRFDTLVGRADAVGAAPGWTLSDMRSLLARKPEDVRFIDRMMGREELFQLLLPAMLGSFVDWETGLCTFDSPLFRELLELCYDGCSFPSLAEIPPEELGFDVPQAVLQEQTQQLCRQPFQSADNLMDFRRKMPQPVTFIGLPTADGSPACILRPQGLGGIALTTGGTQKEAAWAFLRTLLADDGRTSFRPNDGFLISRSAFERMQQLERETMDVLYPGGRAERNLPYSDKRDDPDAVYLFVTPEDQALVQTCLDTAVSPYAVDDGLMAILLDEAGPFFHGRTTAGKAASAIQSRAQIYVSERK